MTRRYQDLYTFLAGARLDLLTGCPPVALFPERLDETPVGETAGVAGVLEVVVLAEGVDRLDGRRVEGGPGGVVGGRVEFRREDQGTAR